MDTKDKFVIVLGFVVFVIMHFFMWYIFDEGVEEGGSIQQLIFGGDITPQYNGVAMRIFEYPLSIMMAFATDTNRIIATLLLGITLAFCYAFIYFIFKYVITKKEVIA